MLVRIMLVLAVAVTAGFVISSSAVASPQPGCAIDENGNCIGNDTAVYSDGEASGAYLTYADGSTTCKAVWAKRNWRNWFRVRLFSYYQQVNWCYRNGIITSLTRYRWPDVSPYAPSWNFSGNPGSNCISEYCQERTGMTETVVYTKGQFQTCIVACSTRYPEVWIGVNGYGGWGWNTAG